MAVPHIFVSSNLEKIIRRKTVLTTYINVRIAHFYEVRPQSTDREFDDVIQHLKGRLIVIGQQQKSTLLGDFYISRLKIDSQKETFLNTLIVKTPNRNKVISLQGNVRCSYKYCC